MERDLRDAFERCLADMRYNDSDINHVVNHYAEFGGAVSAVTVVIGGATPHVTKAVHHVMDKWEQRRA